MKFPFYNFLYAIYFCNLINTWSIFLFLLCKVVAFWNLFQAMLFVQFACVFFCYFFVQFAFALFTLIGLCTKIWPCTTSTLCNIKCFFSVVEQTYIIYSPSNEFCMIWFILKLPADFFTVQSWYFLRDGTVPSRCFLHDGIVPWWYFLRDGTVPSR